MDPVLALSSAQVLAGAAVFIGLVTAVGVASRHRRNDLLALEDAVKTLVLSRALPPRLSFHSQRILRLWNVLLSLRAQHAHAAEQQASLENVVELGTAIAQQVNESQTTADAITQLIARQFQGDVLGVVLLERHSETGACRLASIVGLPRKRLESLLVNCLETGALDRWGYSLPAPGSDLDFSLFGGALILSLPLHDRDNVVGALLVVFRSRVSKISHQRKEFLQSYCQQATVLYGASKRFDKAIQKHEQEKNFFLSISHDLRAPATSALFALRSHLEASSQSDTCAIALLKNIERLLLDQLTSIDNVLTLVQDEHDSLKLRRSPFDLQSELNPLIQDFAWIAQRKGLTLLLDDTPPITALFDRSHFRRIIGNFLSNAIKYTHSGTISVRVTRTSDLVEVRITDSGVGVPSEEQHKLFQRFSRLNNAFGIEGIGLGLSSVAILAQLNGAEPFFEPGKDGGSVFGLRWHQPTEVGALENSDRKNIAGLRFLIIEDDEGVARSLQRLISARGAEAVLASGLGQARRILSERSFAAVLCDLHLTDGTSLELLDSLGELSPPAVILSGSPTAIPEQLPKSVRQVLTKPSHSAELLEALYQAVGS